MINIVLLPWIPKKDKLHRDDGVVMESNSIFSSSRMIGWEFINYALIRMITRFRRHLFPYFESSISLIIQGECLSGLLTQKIRV